MEEFKFKNINFESLGTAFNKLSSTFANETASKATELSLNQQMELNKNNFDKLVADRAKELSGKLSAITSSETRRGIISGGGMAQELAEQYESANKYAEQEMLATERNLIFAQEIEKANAKNARMNSFISIGNSVAGGFSEAFLPYKNGGK